MRAAGTRNKVGKYLLGRTLGEGTFGKVKYAENTESGEKVAVKILEKKKIQQQNMGKQIKREISTMKMVKNPHVVQLKEVLASKSKIYIVLELITGGELFDEIIKETRFTDNKARFYFRQLVEGVAFCHEKGVCHRDLKPENLLLDDDHNLKISDFGLSALLDGSGNTECGSMSASRATLLHTSCGTPNYVAPEVLEDEGYNGCLADIWSMGVILYVLVAGCLPFDEPTMPSLFHKIQSADFNFPSYFSPDLRSLIELILVADPKKRASIETIKSHPWYRVEDSFHPTMKSSGLLKEDAKADDTSDVDIADAKPSNPSKTKPTKVSEGKQIMKDEAILVCPPSELRLKKPFRFYSSKETILTDISKLLESIGCEVIVQDGSEQQQKLKVFKVTPRGMIGLTIQIVPSSIVSSSPSRERNNEKSLSASTQDPKKIIEVRRGKGDILEYHRFFCHLINVVLRHLIESVIK